MDIKQFEKQAIVASCNEEIDALVNKISNYALTMRKGFIYERDKTLLKIEETLAELKLIFELKDKYENNN